MTHIDPHGHRSHTVTDPYSPKFDLSTDLTDEKEAQSSAIQKNLSPLKKTRGKAKAKAKADTGEEKDDKRPGISVEWSVESTTAMLKGFVTAKLEGRQS